MHHGRLRHRWWRRRATTTRVGSRTVDDDLVDVWGTREPDDVEQHANAPRRHIVSRTFGRLTAGLGDDGPGKHSDNLGVQRAGRRR